MPSVWWAASRQPGAPEAAVLRSFRRGISWLGVQSEGSFGRFRRSQWTSIAPSSAHQLAVLHPDPTPRFPPVTAVPATRAGGPVPLRPT